MPFDPLPQLRARLREVGPSSWPAIEKRTKVKVSFMRKVASGYRDNPRLNSIVPLIRYFERIDATKQRPKKRRA